MGSRSKRFSCSGLHQWWRGTKTGTRKDRGYLAEFFAKRAPRISVKERADLFARENMWLGDLRANVLHLALGSHWVRIADREGNVLSAELSTRDISYLLDLCQDQWDVARQYIGRLMRLTPEQFEIARVLFHDGLNLDASIEAAVRL